MVMTTIKGEEEKTNSKLRNSFKESLQINLQDTVQDLKKTNEGIVRSIRSNKPKKMGKNMSKDKEIE